MTNSANDVLLRFENVTIRFDDLTAVNNVSFQMTAGETRVILGSAGSGKTTLLKAAIGLIPVDSGRVYLMGRDITNLAERQLFDIRSQVGVLFQEGGLFDSINIEENVGYPLVNRKTHADSPDQVHTKVVNALRFVELAHTLEKYPNELSGGMRRRVGIARAVITEPPLVLYDSPTAGLDPITATTIMALVAKERDSLNAANLIVTQRYQDGQLMANFRYNRINEHLEPVSNDLGDPDGSNPTRTTFMVMKEGHLIFEGTQARLEASTDAYISKFVPQHHN
ncbi:MAG TPA: ATP-binding cassette domain-containing protein [Bryobacteraceae bacterium]|nr:ATP-binding cassette domain-containing protein [Bryobacteraceae bacterium]